VQAEYLGRARIFLDRQAALYCSRNAIDVFHTQEKPERWREAACSGLPLQKSSAAHVWPMIL
jgi:hypothetical protein